MKRDSTLAYALAWISLICLVIGIGLNGKENFPTILVFGALYGAAGAMSAMLFLGFHDQKHCEKYGSNEVERKP